jgi:hypothetical protein
MVNIGEKAPPPGGISADVMWRQKNIKREKEKEKNIKETLPALYR